MIAIACSPTGITYGGGKDMSTQVISLQMNVFVNVMVLILSPLEDPNLHLQVMSMLAKSFSDPASIRQVAGLRTPAEVTTFFATGKIKMPEYLLARDVMRTDFTPLHETEELYKKHLHDPDNHDGVITRLEPDILECEVITGD